MGGFGEREGNMNVMDDYTRKAAKPGLKWRRTWRGGAK